MRFKKVHSYLLIYVLILSLLSWQVSHSPAFSRFLTDDVLASLPLGWVMLMMVLMGLFSAGMMVFIIKGLLGLIFPEAPFAQLFAEIYLPSVIVASLASLVALLLFPQISYASLVKMSNGLALLAVNLYFYHRFKQYQASIVVLIVTVVNSGLSFFVK